MIASGPAGYTLRSGTDVDLHLIEDAVQAGRSEAKLPERVERLVVSPEATFPAWVLRTAWLQPYLGRYAEALRGLRLTRAMDATRRGDLAAARYYYGLAELDLTAAAAKRRWFSGIALVVVVGSLLNGPFVCNGFVIAPGIS